MSTFKKNIFFTFLTNVLNLGLGLLTGVILARSLGPEGKGIFTIITLIPALFVMLGNFGLSQSSTYFLGQRKYTEEEVFNNLMTWILLSGTTIAVICTGIIYFIKTLEYWEYLLVIIPSIYFLIGSRLLSGFLLGLQKIGDYNRIRLIRSSSHLALYVLFIILMGWKLKGALYAWLISCILEFVFNLIKSYPKNSKFRLKINFNWLKESLRYGKSIYFSNLLGFLNYKADRFIIIAFLNPYQLGLYSIASNLAERIWIIADSISTVLFPKVSSLNSEEAADITRKTSSACIGITVALSAIMILTGNWLIITLFGIDFKDSFMPFAILMIGTVPLSAAKVIAAYFAGIGKQHYMFRIAVISALLNIVLNLLLIPRFNIIGASLASAISYSVVTVIAFYWAKKTSHYPLHSFFSFWKLNYLGQLIKVWRGTS
jgi:O-antigen/teichoic acid export membrane protein